MYKIEFSKAQDKIILDQQTPVSDMLFLVESTVQKLREECPDIYRDFLEKEFKRLILKEKSND